MNRKLVLGLLCGLVLAAGSFLFASTELTKTLAVNQTITPAIPDQGTLTADPYLQQAAVTTSMVEALRCPCTISSGCPKRGFDCADPPGCCHCAGPNPHQLTCVGN